MSGPDDRLTPCGWDEEATAIHDRAAKDEALAALTGDSRAALAERLAERDTEIH